MVSFEVSGKFKWALCSMRDCGHCQAVLYLLLNVRILSIRAVAAKAASVSNLSLRRDVTIAVKMKT